MVHVSLSDLIGLTGSNGDLGAALRDCPHPNPSPDADAGRSGATDNPTETATLTDLPQRIAPTDRLGQVLVTQLRDWLTRHGSIATVTPVVDMNRTDHVDRHDPPEWMANQVRLRDQHCVYPDCARSAWDCDLDHITPYRPPARGGPPGQTRPDNLAPLCRRHHLVKTAGRWRYERNPDGTYLWTNRHNQTWLVTPFGTINITDAA